jgi:hypothetical protein
MTVCKKIEHRYPEAFKAYEKLLSLQSEPYKVHITWIDKKSGIGEAVRGALVLTRVHNICMYFDFENLLLLQKNSYKAG